MADSALRLCRVYLSGALAGAATVLLFTVVHQLILVFLFGLNISIIGLVEMSGDGYRALAEFFGLTVLVMAGNTGFFLAIERRRLFAAAREDGP